MRRIVCDIETNGLLDELNRIWIAVTHDVDTGEQHIFSEHTDKADGDIDDFIEYFKTVDAVIGHNFIGFDIPAIFKVTGYQFEGEVVDTLILSKLLHFTRYRPKGYPTGHSLGAWGAKLGIKKPDQEQWLKWEPNMVTRCVEDVRINVDTYYKLRDEASRQPSIANAIKVEHETSKICAGMTRTGWLVDREKLLSNIIYLDSEVERLRLLVEPLIPKVCIPKDPRCTWEEANEVLGLVWKKVPTTKMNAAGLPIKVTRVPKLPKVLKSGKYDKHSALWFGISQMDALGKKTIAGPHSRISFEPVRLSQHALIKTFLFTQGWVPTVWNFKKCPDTGKTLKDDNHQPIKSSPKLTEDSYDSIKGETGQYISLHATLVHRRQTLENPKDPKKGWLNNLGKDGRLRCDFDTLGAATGRMAHKKLTNVPGTRSVFGKEMRECFIAPKGKLLIGADAAGCQLRLLAGLMGDLDYIKTVVEGIEEDDSVQYAGTDIDKYVGSDVHTVNGLSTGLISQDDHQWLLDNTPSHKKWHTVRDRVVGGRGRAKNFIYGLLFGAGDAKIGLLVDGTAKDGKRLKDNFFASWPKLKAMVEDLLNEWRANKAKYKEGWITGVDGRRIYVESEHKCLNYKLQGDEAIFMKYTLVLADRLIKKNKIDSKWLLIYHDEFESETSPSDKKRVMKIYSHCFAKVGEELGIKCPMSSSPKVGLTWYDIH
jgi:hypothetical protein